MRPDTTVLLRITLGLAVALLLATAAGGALAQDTGPGTVRGEAIILDAGCADAPCAGSTWQVDFSWEAAQPPPDSYRLDYAVKGKWQSWKKANTPSKGTVFISPAEHGRSGGYSLRGIYVPYGKSMCFRVKARYQGERDGPWTKLCV